MKTRYAIEPTFKKSVYEYNTFRKEIDGELCYATLETGWRWGRFEISLDADEVKEIVESSETEVHLYDDFELVYCDDGCWETWSFSSNMPENIREQIQELWNEEGFSGIEEDDWDILDCEYTIDGSVKLEKVNVTTDNGV